MFRRTLQKYTKKSDYNASESKNHINYDEICLFFDFGTRKVVTKRTL